MKELSLLDFYEEGILIALWGCMFSGKTGNLVKLVTEAQRKGLSVVTFKHSLDDRYVGLNKISSHDGRYADAIPINDPENMLRHISNAQIVVIDEAQFFSNHLLSVVMTICERGMCVVCGGLDTDFRGEGFGVMPDLIHKARHRFQLFARCNVNGCHEEATQTQRVTNGAPAHYNSPLILVGASDSYEARCKKHHEVPGKPELVRA